MFVSTLISLWPTPDGLAHMLPLYADIVRGALSFLSLYALFIIIFWVIIETFLRFLGSGLKRHPYGHYKRSESTVFLSMIAILHEEFLVFIGIIFTGGISFISQNIRNLSSCRGYFLRWASSRSDFSCSILRFFFFFFLSFIYFSLFFYLIFFLKIFHSLFCALRFLYGGVTKITI